MKKTNFIAVLTAICGLLACGCSDSDSDTAMNYGISSDYSVTKSALSAKCDVRVLKNGNYKTVQFETDYLPNVSCCELPEAANSEEAMRVQAIVGRSFGYSVLGWRSKNPYLKDSTDDQVYSCSYFSKTKNPETWEKCLKGVKDTSGLVVYRKGSLLATYYRSGCPVEYLDNDCIYRGSKSGCGAHNIETEGKITHNWGKSGSSVETLYDDGDPAGCLSHTGTKCLAEKGWVSLNILKFFYGMDIELRQAEGDCIEVQKCETQLNGSETIIDDRDKCFVRTISENYYTVGTNTKSGATSVGHNGSLQFAYTTSGNASAVGTWRVNVKSPGDYRVYAYVDSKVGNLSKKAVYTVRANSSEKSVTVDLSGSTRWVELGKFKFAAGEDQWIKLTDATGEAYTNANGTRVVFDALKFVYVAPCTNQCSTNGAKECSGSGYRTCADSNGDGCLEWSAVTACKNTEKCQSGACVLACTNQCSSNGAKECSGSGYRTCADSNGDGCLEWSSVVECKEKEKCQSGACVISCTDQCSAKDAKECHDNGYRICADSNGDGCLEWSSVVACDETEVCEEGNCVEKPISCTNECEAGEIECSDDNFGIRKCDRYDENECLKWSEVEPCDSGMICQNGECVEDVVVPDDSVDMPDTCLTEVDGKETIIDELDACFVQSDSSNWLSLNNSGYEEHLDYAYVRMNDLSAVGTWYLNVTQSGKYQISVYIPGIIGSIKPKIEYTVKAGDDVYHPVIDVPEETNGWVDLGLFELSEGELQYVKLEDKTDNANEVENELRVVFDAIRIQPESVLPADSDGDNKDASVSMSASSCSVGVNSEHTAGLWMMMACFGGLMLLRRRKSVQQTRPSAF